jgi:hypothetical protein
VGFAGSFTKDVQRCEFCDENSFTRDHIHYFLNKNWWSLALVAHAHNPIFSGGRYQEDNGSKPAWTNDLGDLISKIPNPKMLLEWLMAKALCSSSSTTKKKYKNKKNWGTPVHGVYKSSTEWGLFT